MRLGAALVIAGIVVACVTGYYFVNEKEIQFRRRMRPVIDSVDAFIERHGRCPSFGEFHNIDEQGLPGPEDEHAGFILRFDTEFVRSVGGTERTDYILGTWTGEWHYCYRSWDGEYFHDYDNAVFGG